MSFVLELSVDFSYCAVPVIKASCGLTFLHLGPWCLLSQYIPTMMDPAGQAIS